MKNLTLIIGIALLLFGCGGTKEERIEDQTDVQQNDKKSLETKYKSNTQPSDNRPKNVFKKNTSKQEINNDIENTILYVLYDHLFGLEDSTWTAVPILLFEKGEYIRPEYCYEDYVYYISDYTKDEKRNFERACKVAKEKFAPFVEKGKTLFLLSNGMKIAEIIVKRSIRYGISDATIPAASLEKSIYNGRLLTNNGNLGTKMIDIPQDLPSLPKRKDDGGFGAGEIPDDTFLTDVLIGFVDLNGDGSPELVYEHDSHYGLFYTIYSKSNDVWEKVFESVPDGVE